MTIQVRIEVLMGHEAGNRGLVTLQVRIEVLMGHEAGNRGLVTLQVRIEVLMVTSRKRAAS